MKIVKPSVEIVSKNLGKDLLKQIETAARNCYKSESSITEDSCLSFVEGLIRRGHTAMLEFADVTAKLICDRGVMGEITRHRHLSFAIESSRYNCYNKDKFGNEITVIDPCYLSVKRIDSVQEATEEQKKLFKLRTSWLAAMEFAEKVYMGMLKDGATAQEARAVLPSSLKTEIFVKGNLREWRHVFLLRCDKAAHPQMREVMFMLLDEMHKQVPLVFDDLYNQYSKEIEEGKL